MKKIIISLFFLLLLSCGEAEKLFFHIEGNDAFDTCMLDNKFTIFCYIDSSGCAPCALQWLHRWTYSYFEDELNKLKTGVALIIRNSDEEAIHDVMTYLRYEFPVIFDRNSAIKHNNEAILDQRSVFVVNRKKEVVWLGVPLESENSWALFCKTLRRQSRRKK